MTIESLPLTLPLIDFLDSKYGVTRTQLFTGYKILAVQHLLGSTVPLIRKLIAGGAKCEDIFIVGKAYSSHKNVVEYLSSLGCKVFDTKEIYTPDGPHDDKLELLIEKAFSILTDQFSENDWKNKGLIIDDAGKGIEILHSRFPKFLCYFRCVEQTSRGIKRLESIELRCPVVNVAKSWAKQKFETPLISGSMLTEFFSFLSRYRSKFQLENYQVLQLGFGVIGESVAHRLRTNNFDVTVFDKDLDRLNVAQKRNFKICRERSEGYLGAGVIIGCTGTTSSIPLNEFSKIEHGAILINMASSDLEFAPWKLFDKSSIISLEGINRNKDYFRPWKNLYKIRNGAKSFYLANGGFPIDFSGQLDPIPSEKIQLTRGLLFMASIQASQAKDKGLQQLDINEQNELVTKYLQLNQ